MESKHPLCLSPVSVFISTESKKIMQNEKGKEGRKEYLKERNT